MFNGYEPIFFVPLVQSKTASAVLSSIRAAAAMLSPTKPSLNSALHGRSIRHLTILVGSTTRRPFVSQNVQSYRFPLDYTTKTVCILTSLRSIFVIFFLDVLGSLIERLFTMELKIPTAFSGTLRISSSFHPRKQPRHHRLSRLHRHHQR